MNLQLSGDSVHIQLALHEQLFAVRGSSKLIIPFGHIREASAVPPVSSSFDLRIPGTFVPGLIKAGTYYSARGKEFWYVTRAWRLSVLVLELQAERYNRLVLGLPDAEGWATRIGAALR
ncbi:hypothetical protein [Hyalangium versicolor]|uniref:hypothetical protein n=1 Tax=Hyalangium versicolor TaxID=2861190 RepID=UPI001CCA5D4F|nr:hypothetical protein [Hyalangium versicolor]